MKQLKLISTFIILTNLLACEPPVTFNEPQPIDTANLSKFPKRIQGQYLSLEDSSTLLISDKLIQRIYDFDYKVHPNQLDCTSRLSDDTNIGIKTNEKTKIKHDGDSLITHIHYIATLFQMDYDNVVKKLKGYYFLNIRYDKTSWEVKKIQLTKGQLRISSISTKLDIDNLKEITEKPIDTVPPYKFTATKKQFKEFIKNDGFSDSEIFVRQKKNGL
jgi:Holliday junction resolvase